MRASKRVLKVAKRGITTQNATQVNLMAAKMIEVSAQVIDSLDKLNDK